VLLGIGLKVEVKGARRKRSEEVKRKEREERLNMIIGDSIQSHD
jgi:hypothetical protein